MTGKVPKRAPKKGRPLKGTPDWKKAFLAVFAKTGNVSASCELAQVSRTTVFSARRKDKKFLADWNIARTTAIDALELEARRRALEGWEEPVFHQGRPCGIWIDDNGRTYGDKEVKPDNVKFVQIGVRKFSDTLLIFLLKGNRPKKFRENIKHEHGGAEGGPIQNEVKIVEDENWYGNRTRLESASTLRTPIPGVAKPSEV